MTSGFKHVYYAYKIYTNTVFPVVDAPLIGQEKGVKTKEFFHQKYHTQAFMKTNRSIEETIGLRFVFTLGTVGCVVAELIHVDADVVSAAVFAGTQQPLFTVR